MIRDNYPKYVVTTDDNGTSSSSVMCIMTEYNEELHNRTLREDGRAAGREEGRLEGEGNLSILYRVLEKANRLDDFGRSMYDKRFLEELKKEFREQINWE